MFSQFVSVAVKRNFSIRNKSPWKHQEPMVVEEKIPTWHDDVTDVTTQWKFLIYNNRLCFFYEWLPSSTFSFLYSFNTGFSPVLYIPKYYKFSFTYLYYKHIELLRYFIFIYKTRYVRYLNLFFSFFHSIPIYSSIQITMRIRIRIWIKMTDGWFVNRTFSLIILK